MNWLDYLLIAILGFSALRSFSRGFTREIIGLAAAILALFLGIAYYRTGAALISSWVSSQRTANFAGFLLVVFAILLLGMIVGSIVRRFVKAVGLSFFDRLLGACFGLLRGAVIAIALLTAYIAFGPRSDPKSTPEAVVHSQIAPYLLNASSVFVSAAPVELKRNFGEVYDEARTQIKNIARSSTGATNTDSGKK